MQDKIRALLNKHCDTLKRQGAELDVLLSKEHSGDSLELLSQAVFIAHTIKGGSGTMGFPSVSTCAGKIEHSLRGCLERNVAPDEAQFQEIGSHNRDLQILIQNLDPAKSGLWDRTWDLT